MELCVQIRQRFDFNDHILKFFSNFTPEKAISGDVLSIVKICSYFPSIDVDVEELNTQWRLLPEFEDLKNISVLGFEQFWSHIINCKNKLNVPMFSNLTKVNKCVMCIPHSSVCAKRIFSQLNNIKTKLRNKLEVKTCDNIFHCKDLMGNDNCTTWKLLFQFYDTN